MNRQHCMTMIQLKVLIDTWWNVNQLIEGVATIFQGVLIDTWWNVN